MRVPLVPRLVDYWIRAQSSYWLVPSLMTAFAIGLAVTMVAIDGAAPERIARIPWIAGSQPEGARALLAAVAGSMITVAGVTFSMTLLMVSYASAQIGPQLVPRFLRDRGNQIVLGTFIATFIYCLIVLRTIHSGAEASAQGFAETAFVPHLAVFVGVVLALLSVAVLIYFLHHVPARINVGNVIGLLGEELLRQLERQFPRAADTPAAPAAWRVVGYPDRVIYLTEGGCYLRLVDYDALAALAHRMNRQIELLVAPGDFSPPGAPIARIYGGPFGDEDVRSLRGSFSWGGDRTADQDILLGIDQLAEVAGKALSTGVNDQYTALLCIDQMERLLVSAAIRCEPPSVRAVDGTTRLLVKNVSLTDVADRFLIPLRQFSLGDLITTNRLLAMLESCMQRQEPGSPLHATLRQHYEDIRDDAATALPTRAQRELLMNAQARRLAAAAHGTAAASGVTSR